MAKPKPPDYPVIDMMKTESGRLRISRSEFKGVDRIDIRHFYLDKDSDEFKPTKKGVSIPVEKIPALIKRLKAIAEL